MGLHGRMEGHVPLSNPVGGTALGGVRRGVGAGRGLSWARLRASFPPLARVMVSAAIALPAVAIVVYTFLNVYSEALPTSDGMTHTIEIRELAETGRLPKTYTYLATDSSPQGVTWRPIDYPLTFYIISSFFWMLDGVNGLYVLTSLSAALAVLFGYLIFARINRWLAGAAGALVLMLPFERYTMVVLIEQLLLPVMLAAVYFYGRFWETPAERKWKFALLVGVLTGLAIGLKQQGYILAMGLALHGVAAYLFTRVRGNPFPLKHLLLMTATAILVAAIPIIDNTARNGTILGSDFGLLPGLTKHLPFFRTK